MNGPQTTFVGRLGQDPELRFGAKGTPWVSFSVASDKVIGQPNPDGTRERKTTWIRVKAFNQMAENIAASLSKGAPVVVVGSLELEKWTGNDGVERSELSCIADSVGLDLRRATAEWSKPERTDSAYGGNNGGGEAYAITDTDAVDGSDEPF